MCWEPQCWREFFTTTETMLEIDHRRKPRPVREEPVDPPAFLSSVSTTLQILLKKEDIKGQESDYQKWHQRRVVYLQKKTPSLGFPGAVHLSMTTVERENVLQTSRAI